MCSGRSLPISSLIYIIRASLADFSSFFITDMSFIQHITWGGNMLLLYSTCRRETAIKHFTSFWISIYDSLSARNKVETKCAWRKRTQPTFGKSSDNIRCKCLLYKIFSSFSLLATVLLYSLKCPMWHCISAIALFSSTLSLLQLHHLLFGIQYWLCIQRCQNPEFENNYH